MNLSTDTVEVERQLCALGGTVAHHFGPDAYIKEAGIPAGTMLAKHQHAFGHASVLLRGRVRVRIGSDGPAQTFRAPAALLIPAGQQHTIEALEDSVWLCCHDAAGLGDDDMRPGAIDVALMAKGS